MSYKRMSSDCSGIFPMETIGSFITTKMELNRLNKHIYSLQLSSLPLCICESSKDIAGLISVQR